MVEHLPYNIAPTYCIALSEKKCEQGYGGSDREASQPRGRLWPGNTLQVQTVPPEGIHREAQETY